MPFFAGYINNYNHSTNNELKAGDITGYTPHIQDVIVATSCPNADNSGTSDNLNISTRYEDTFTNPSNSYPRWVFEVCNLDYAGDISFQIISDSGALASTTPPSPPGPPNTRGGLFPVRLERMVVDVALAEGPMPLADSSGLTAEEQADLLDRMGRQSGGNTHQLILSIISGS